MRMDVSTLETITRLAAQYGPFLFAMLFILVVTRTAHTYYRESNMRQQPRASEEEKKTYRSYFTTSAWVGVALALLSIGWWIYVQMVGPGIYQVAIVGLRPDEAILSQYFSKTVPRPTMPGADTLTDDYFIISQEQPLKIGDKFEFYYFKTQATHTPSPPGAQPATPTGVSGTSLKITYSGNKQETYEVTQTNGAVSLRLASKPTVNSILSVANHIKTLRPQLSSTAVASLKRSDQ
jgi:hypothetical protein